MHFSDFFFYLLFAVIVVANYFLKSRRSAQRHRAPSPPPEDAGVDTAPEVPQNIVLTSEPDWRMKRTRSIDRKLHTEFGSERPALATAETTLGRARSSPYAAAFKKQDGIRQAIVSRAVIGPCRADSPYGESN
jgi:hypothetical protein